MLIPSTLDNKDFDIYAFLRKRPLSWSQYDCFAGKEWGSPEKWYQRYFLNVKDEPTEELIFGSYVDKKIQEDLTFLPKLERFPNMQFKMSAEYNRIKMVGYADGWCRKTLRLTDYKTGKAGSYQWTQKKADATGQLTFYAAMIYITYNIDPSNIGFQIDWLPTVKDSEGKLSLIDGMFADGFTTFKTKRSMVQVAQMLANIERTVAAMQEYVRNHD